MAFQNHRFFLSVVVVVVLLLLLQCGMEPPRFAGQQSVKACVPATPSRWAAAVVFTSV